MIYINKKARITGAKSNIQLEIFKAIKDKENHTKRHDWVHVGNYGCVEHALNAYYKLYQNSKANNDEVLQLKQFFKDCAEFKSKLSKILNV